MNTVLLAFLNTIWQSTAIAAAVWLLLKLARGTNAATRHAVWWATLAVVILLPIVPKRTAVVGTAPEPIMVAAPMPLPDLPREVPAPAPRSGIELPGGSWTSVVFGAWMLACLLQLGRTAWSYRYLRTLKRESALADRTLRRNFDAWM